MGLIGYNNGEAETLEGSLGTVHLLIHDRHSLETHKIGWLEMSFKLPL